MKIKNLLILILAGSILLFIPGCSDIWEVGELRPADYLPLPRETGNYKLAPTTEFIQNTGVPASAIKGLDSTGTLSLYAFDLPDSSLNKLQPGQNLIGPTTEATPAGFGVVIEEISQDGDKLLLKTRPAALTELFEELDVHFTAPLRVSSFPGEVDYREDAIVIPEIVQTLKVGVPVKGEVDLRFSARMDWEITGDIKIKGFKLESFNLGYEGASEFRYGMTVDVPLIGVYYEHTLATVPLAGISVGPVVLTFCLKPKVEGEISLNSGFSIDYTVNSSSSAKLIKDSDEDPRIIKEKEVEIETSGEILKSEFEASAYFTPSLSMGLWGSNCIEKPDVTAEVFLDPKLGVKYLKNRAEPKSKLFGCFELEAGAALKLFKRPGLQWVGYANESCVLWKEFGGNFDTCSDGIRNGDETGVDCGGSCTPCGQEPSCTDGIQNGDETGVDCGGSCNPCVSDQSKIEVSGNLDFGNVQMGSSKQRTFTIRNTGTKDFDVSSISYPNGFSGNWNGGRINSNATRTVTVTFAPSSAQPYGGQIIVHHNADIGDGTISCSGYGEQAGYADLIVDNLEIEEESDGEYTLIAYLKNIGNAPTPSGETIYIKYFIDDQLVDDDNFRDLGVNEAQRETKPNYNFSGPGYHTYRVDILDCSNENNTSNNSHSITINISSTGLSITPSNSCSTAPVMELNTEYEVNIGVGDYMPSIPIDGESYNGENVRGFWVKFKEPAGYVGDLRIKIYDVSNNFDPVIGHKINCNSIYYTQWNKSTLVANERGYGGSETFDDYSNNNGYTHYVRIYHYRGSQTPDISFKIKVEQ